MEINGYPVIVPIGLRNGNYGLQFTGDQYKLISIDDLMQDKPVSGGSLDLDTMVMEKMKEDPSYMKRINMKVVASKRKKE